MSKVTKGYTPIWNYTASGINWMVKNKIWEDTNGAAKDWYHSQEGIKISIIISIASVIEGSLRTYLKNKIEKAIENKKMFDAPIISDNYSNSELIGEIELDHPIFLPNEFKINYKVENDEFLSNLLKKFPIKKKCPLGVKECPIKNNDVGKVKQILNWLTSKVNPVQKSNFISDDEKLDKIISIIDKAVWNDLLGYFKKVTGKRLKTELNKVDKGLFNDLEYIFHFRNFLVHSNEMKLEFNVDNLDVTFRGRAKSLMDYMDEKNLNLEIKEGIRFIELLVPNNVVIHFRNSMNSYFKSEFFRENMGTSNLVNLIWRK